MSGYEDFFRGKTVTLMGLGLLGRGVGDAAFLSSLCCKVHVTDLKSAEALAPSVDALRGCGNIEFHLGAHAPALFCEADFVVKGAGVPLDSPHVAQARAHGVPVHMSTALFAHLSPARIVGVTGTRGKSTVTQMLYEILRDAGRPVLLGGNVRGVSTLAMLPQATAAHTAVLELDSWQLQGFDDLGISPRVSVFTTFLPDHMNYYRGDVARYLHDKASIFRHQGAADTLVVSHAVLDALRGQSIPSRLVVAEPLPEGFGWRLPGAHNLRNGGLARDAALALGVDAEQADGSLRRFEALEGRLQLLRAWRGVAFYNDTNATTQDATVAALRSFDAARVVLILGGADKGLPIDAMAGLIAESGVRCVALDGTGTARLRERLPALAVANSMEEAVAAAVALARPGDVVLLSPGFASFGMFANEYERGDRFMQAVTRLA